LTALDTSQVTMLVPLEFLKLVRQ